MPCERSGAFLRENNLKSCTILNRPDDREYFLSSAGDDSIDRILFQLVSGAVPDTRPKITWNNV